MLIEAAPLKRSTAAAGDASDRDICPFDAASSNYGGTPCVAVVMRTFAAVLLIGMTAALTAPRWRRPNSPRSPPPTGPVPPPLDPAWAPANAGGDNGPQHERHPIGGE